MRYGLLCALCLFAGLVSADPVRATFTWQPVDNADGYALYYEDALLAEVTNETTYSEVLDLAPGPHRFAMQAFNDVGPGPRRTITREYAPPRTAPTDAPEFDVILLVQGTGGNPGGGNEPDVTPPLAPAGVFNNGVTTNTARTNWTSNGEPDLQDYRVYRSSVGPSSGFSLVSTVSAPTSLFDHTGLASETQYWVYVTARDNATPQNESEASSVTTFTTTSPPISGPEPYDINTVRHTTELATAGQSRTPPAWVTNGTFQWASQPQGTLTEVTANTFAELQSYLNGSQLRITIPASFGTQSGSLTPTGSDIEVVMSNLAQLNVTGDFDLVNANRIKWTGGNVVCSNVGGRIRLRGTDIIFDDFYGMSNADAGNFSGAVRLVLINSTIDQQGDTNNSWAIFTLPTATQNNWLLGNVRLESDGQNNRFQNVDNLIILDSVFNPDNRSANSHRLHKEIDNMWHADNALGLGGFLSDASSGYAYGVGNATFERLLVHSSLRAILTDSEFSGTSTIQGSASRTTNTNTLSGTPAIGNLTDLGGNHYEDEDGNLNQQWDGTTYPAYWANVGAQR